MTLWLLVALLVCCASSTVDAVKRKERIIALVGAVCEYGFIEYELREKTIVNTTVDKVVQVTLHCAGVGASGDGSYNELTACLAEKGSLRASGFNCTDVERCVLTGISSDNKVFTLDHPAFVECMSKEGLGAFGKTVSALIGVL
uniref:Uncharacterized protein n=1 Tax=Pristionchus pacificus TaxID=54126 RepID=A0A454XKH4_PRIPA|eukprot:PDM71982.1 hypothetical protein PRIPAC_38389 [Pristionchus pacificus]